MFTELENKVVLISGGAESLAPYVTRAFLEYEAIVFVSYTLDDDFENLKKHVHSSGLNRLIGVKNFSHEEKDIKHLVKKVTENTGTIDVLVNIIGSGMEPGSKLTKHEDHSEKTIVSNLKSVVNTCKYVIPLMIKQKQGRVINVRTRPGLSGKSSLTSSVATETALIKYTKTLANECLSENITFSVVMPGTLDTPANRNAMPNANFNDWVTGDSFAGICLFIASGMARDINGAIVPVFGRS